jgi:hypothetical protein
MDTSLKQIQSETGETFIPVAIEDPVAYWTIIYRKETRKNAVLVTCAMESIERADAVFGVIRTEEEHTSLLPYHAWFV